MQSEEQLLERRFRELSGRAQGRCEWVYSDFLNEFEQNLLLRLSAHDEVVLFGGFADAERKIAAFGNEEVCGSAAEFPITVLKIAPKNPKFAESLAHRDCLGSLMALGIKRETLGDILLSEGVAYLFCQTPMAPYITENLHEVRHTAVTCTLAALPEELREPEPEERTIVVASERLDAAIAAVYNLSRSQSSALVVSGKVFLGGRPTEDSSAVLKPGTMVSVRSYGRFLWCGSTGLTKKQRLKVSVKVY